jgi:C-terminal processing protease CtpA/Prc
MTDQLTATALVEAVNERLSASYIFPDRAMQAATLLRSNLAAGRYDVPVGPDLCERVSADLFQASADKHLRLIWHDSVQASQNEEALVAELREMFQRENYGIRSVERLPGNVGKIAFTVIPEASAAGPAMTAAMRLVEHTQALILDLRDTRGGSPDGVTYLCSYFFADGDTHLNDIVDGPHGPTHQYWTAGYVSGPRYLEREVYILTSANTFSGGEELAYDLQALRRAIVVGEVTRGGAHPSIVMSVGEHIELRLPVARAVNPITGSNWEAVGVQPDRPTPASVAQNIAHRAALERIISAPGISAAAREEARQALGDPAGHDGVNSY